MTNRGHNLTTTTWVELPDGSEVEVEWEFSPIVPDRSTGPVEGCYPPEGGELLSCVVRADFGGLNEDWLREQLGDSEFEAEADDAINQAFELDQADRADRLYDEWRDRKLEVWLEDDR